MEKMFDTSLKEFRFKKKDNAALFAMSLPGYFNPVVKRGLPQYKGQVETGWTVYAKANSIASELAMQTAYKQIANDLKMEGI